MTVAGQQRVRAARTGDLLDTLERRTGLTPTGLTLAAFAILAWLGGWRLSSRVLFLMSYGTALLLVALALAGRRAIALAAERSSLPKRMRERQTVSVELTLTARKRLGGIVLEERIDGVRAPVRLLVSALRPDQPLQHRYTFTPSRRGVYPVGPLSAIWSDPFGLTRRRTVLTDAEEVIVHPSTEPVRDRVLSREWEDPPVRPPISKPWPTGFEFYGMRDYVAGDDPRRIVWRAVARTDRYLVREAEQGITDRVTILLDTDAARHSPGDPSETFEAGVRAAASLGLHHLGEGFQVTATTSDGPLAPALRGPAAKLLLLDALARVARGSDPLAHGIGRALRDPRRDTHNIIVSPHLDHEAASLLRLLVDRSGSVTFVHLVTEESDPQSVQRAAALGCEVVELEPGAPLAASFRRGTGAGLRR